MSETKDFIWHCQRMGGTDQVMLSTMQELRHLRDLDPKLWGALSCPAKGLEFDHKTLALLDTDGDGRIRMPEILDACEWLCQRVNDTADIPNEPTSLPLSAINEECDHGQRLKTTAQTIYRRLGLTRNVSPPIRSMKLQKALQSSPSTVTAFYRLWKRWMTMSETL